MKEDAATAARSALECGGKRQRDTVFARTERNRMTTGARPQNLPKAVWRWRFPPHSITP